MRVYGSPPPAAYHGIVGHFCVECGTPLEPKQVEGRDVEGCPRCSFVLWHDPKVVTIVVVENDSGEVVMGRRAIHPGYGLWCLPGGFVNDDEHPASAAVRECQEEICAEVEIVSLLGVYHIQKRDAASMVGIGYLARLPSGSLPSAGSEMLEVATFPRQRLPQLAFASHGQVVSDWLANGEESRAETT
ncbi:MAG: NUDIX domain-containing protein [Candidatus Dormibacteraeota bacterium]|nr:NUDIX domain-containing protein [Candidatus Dormibacteraeota bacterium]